MSAGRLTQELRQVMQNSEAITKDGGLNIIFPNMLADSLDIKLLEL